MITTNLLTPILDGGIASTNFFNGRVLTAEDLRNDQTANRLQHRQLGEGIGSGVVRGLEVRVGTAAGANPTVKVTAGLAISRRGDAVAIADDVGEVEIALVRAAPPISADAGFFGECAQAVTNAVPAGIGGYLLVIAPAAGYQGRAPMVGLADAGVARRCASGNAVEGVTFRLVSLAIDDPAIASADIAAWLHAVVVQPGAANMSRVRNVLAHLCLGTARATGHSSDPFARAAGPRPAAVESAVDVMYAAGTLRPCEVPLAMIHWGSGGISFVDMGSVRRIVRPNALRELFPGLHGYGEERLYQFVEHVEALVTTPGMAGLRIDQLFRFVPALGYVPVAGIGSAEGFAAATFFDGFTIGTLSDMYAGAFRDLAVASFQYDAVDLAEHPALQLFRVRENTQAVQAAGAGRSYLVFVSRTLNGPLVLDGMTQSLQTAWEVYRSLTRRSAFLPSASDAVKIGARHAIVTAIGDVTAIANRYATLAAGRSLTAPDGIAAFQQMHRIQDELASLLKSNIPGILEPQARQAFGQTIATYLNVTIPGGGKGLLPAVQASDLAGAVHAQDAINAFVGSWVGAAVAIGFIQLAYIDSPRGVAIVRGDANPFPHNFRVTNLTDMTLSIALHASVAANGAEWANGVRLFDATGAPIESVTLASGANTTIAAMVTAPAAAAIGSTASLSVTASVGEPHDKSAEAHVAMTVADKPGDPVTRVVDVPVVAMPNANLDDMSPGQVVSIGFRLRYTAASDPLSLAFVVSIINAAVNAGGSLSDWFVTFQNPTPVNAWPGLPQADLTLQSAAPTDQLLVVQVRAPLQRQIENDMTFKFDFRIASIGFEHKIFKEVTNFLFRLRGSRALR